MYSQKTQKSQFPPQSPLCEGQEYPCPCRRQANLVPIYLTDAFGCDRCPQVFVMNEEGCIVEQLTGGYPYARVWRWTGQQWKILQPKSDRGVLLFLALLCSLVVGWFVLKRYLIWTPLWLYWGISMLVVIVLLPIFQSRFNHRR